MQVSIENTANLERRLTVSLPAERLQGAVEHRLREIARTANIKGFRAGKVPPKVIEQRWGAQVRNEAYNELVRQTLNEALNERNIKIAGNPQIKPEGEGEGGEVRYSAVFEVVPDFGQIDVTGLQIVKPVARVEEGDVDVMIETLRQQRRSWDPVERAAAVGDLANVEIHSLADGVRTPAEGSERAATVIGSAALFPAIEAALVGMSPGEERTVPVAFPENWRIPALAGKTAQVTLRVERVSAPRLPEVDEAFIRSFGVKSGKPEQFRKEVRNNLERELRGSLMNRLRAEVLQKLIAAHSSVELPPRLIEQEARNLASKAEQQAQQGGGQPPAASFEAFLPQARTRVAAGLLVGEVARQNGIRLDPRRVHDMIQLIASTYEEPQQVVELYRNDPTLLAGLQNRVMEEQVVDWLSERAQATEQTLSFAEAVRPQA